MGFEPMCDLTRKLISSQPRYDHFDTSPCVYFNPATSGRRKEIGEKCRRENKKILSCECSENPVKSMVFKDERSEVPTRFRVRRVMTTSLRLHSLFIIQCAIDKVKKKPCNFV